MKEVQLRRWEVALAFIMLTISFTVSVGWMTHLQHELNRKNAERITDIQALNHERLMDIQQERLESCRRGYEGVRQVFRPFFSPPGKRKPAERKTIRKFDRIVDHLKAHCSVQTGVKGSP